MMWRRVSWFLFIYLAALASQRFTCSAASLMRPGVNRRYKYSITVSNPHENDSLGKRRTADKNLSRERREKSAFQEQKDDVSSPSGGQQVMNMSLNLNSLTPPVNFSIPVLPLPLLPKPNVSSTLVCQSYMFSCRGRCQSDRVLGATQEKRQCFCDKSCELFQDCCADYDQYCPTSGTLVNSRQHDLWTCVRGGHMTEAEGVWMISSCPTNWTQNDVKDRCNHDHDISYDNHRDILPVVDRKNNSYKNQYCAECHGLKLDEVTFYNINFSCLVAVPEEYATEVLKFLFTYCSKISWQPPTGFSRRYCYSFPTKRHCSQVFPPDVSEKCFQGPVRVVYDLRSQRNFLNSFCAQCNGVTRFQCGPGHALDDGDITPAMPFSIVMDAGFANDDDTSAPKIRKMQVSCGQGNVYDFHLQICRRGIKPFKTFPRHKIYSVSALFQSNLSYSQPLIDPASFIQAFIKALKTREILISTTEIRNHPGPVTTLVFNLDIDSNKTSQLSIQNFTRAMRNISIVVLNVKFTVVKVSAKPIMCVKVATFKPDEYTFQNNVVKIQETGEIIEQMDYLSNATEWKDGTAIPVGFLFVCKQKTQLNCTGVLVSLHEKEYILLPNGSLYRNSSEELYKPDAFQTVNGTIWICTNFSENYTREDDITIINNKKSNNKLLVILTNVGLSLSVFCLVLVLGTFIIFRELRTLPGINLMNLSFALLLSHSLYFLTGQVKAKITCTVTAILLQYFFLVSFQWMSIIAFDTWRAMSKIRVRREERFKTRFPHVLRCIALGWLPAIGLVGVCIALDRLKAVSFHYGGVKACWINNRKANLFFFVLPVAVSLSVNAVFFFLTVKVIRRTSKQARQVTNQSQRRKDVAVFFKIFVLMGFTWFFGFLRLLVSRYFDYPFIVFTTLQGVYIAVAFVFTARVKKMYCALFRQNSNSVSQKKNVSSPVVLSKFVKTRQA